MSDSGVTGDFDELVALERRFKRLTGAAIAKAGARAIGAVAQRQYKAGTGPDGKAWPLNKDGTKPLRNAPGEVTFSAAGTTIRGHAPLHYIFHARRTPVFPAEGGAMPAPWFRALEGAAQQVVEGKKQ